MPQIPVDLTILAPIPVGHRVRLTWFVLESRGLFGTSQTELPHEPVVEDLDTGIVYCSERPYEHEGVKRQREPVNIEPRLAGTTHQTHLVVET